MIARHDCPNAKINRPLSYCTHVLRAYIWLGPIRLRMRLRPVWLDIPVRPTRGYETYRRVRIFVPQFELRWITQRMLAEYRAFESRACATFKVGDKVKKNAEGWIEADADLEGRGDGVGEIVETFPLEVLVLVRWPACHAYQYAYELEAAA